MSDPSAIGALARRLGESPARSPDAATLRAAVAGDAAAVAAVLATAEHTIRRAVGRSAVRSGLQPADIDDARQDARAAVWRALPRFDGSRSFVPWVWSIATRATWKVARRRSSSVTDAAVDPDEVAAECTQETALLAREVVAALPVDARDEVAAVLVHGHSFDARGAALGVHPHTVRYRVNAALWTARHATGLAVVQPDAPRARHDTHLEAAAVAALCADRDAGLTWSQISARYGVSMSWAHALYRRHGGRMPCDHSSGVLHEAAS